MSFLYRTHCATAHFCLHFEEVAILVGSRGISRNSPFFFMVWHHHGLSGRLAHSWGRLDYCRAYL